MNLLSYDNDGNVSGNLSQIDIPKDLTMGMMSQTIAKLMTDISNIVGRPVMTMAVNTETRIVYGWSVDYILNFFPFVCSENDGILHDMLECMDTHIIPMHITSECTTHTWVFLDNTHKIVDASQLKNGLVRECNGISYTVVGNTLFTEEKIMIWGYPVGLSIL